jgi:PBP1b-binding outer membrane lipoprotein LpoB
MKSKLSFLLFLSLLIAGCYSSKFTTYQLENSTDEIWQVKVEKSGMLPVIKVTVNDSTVIDESFPAFDWIGINTSGSYNGHSVELMVTYNSGFIGIGSSYSAVITIDKKYFVGQFRLPTISFSGD